MLKEDTKKEFLKYIKELFNQGMEKHTYMFNSPPEKVEICLTKKVLEKYQIKSLGKAVTGHSDGVECTVKEFGTNESSIYSRVKTVKEPVGENWENNTIIYLSE